MTDKNGIAPWVVQARDVVEVGIHRNVSTFTCMPYVTYLLAIQHQLHFILSV